MDVNMIRNGYNVERRKMYPANRNFILIQQGTTWSVQSISSGKNLCKMKNSILIICLKSKNMLNWSLSHTLTIEL